MKIYLDSCSLQRPLDDQRQVRIATETGAVLGVLTLWEAGQVELVGSDVLDYEASLILMPERKTWMLEVLSRMDTHVDINPDIERLAAWFNSNGIKPLDALHLACAENVKADYFCTCDDKFLKKAKSLPGVAVQIVSPLELVAKLP